MLNAKEVLVILIATVILALTLSFAKGVSVLLIILASVFLIILINTAAKKIASFYLDSEIEVDIWKIQRYGFKPDKYLKKPFPAGIFFPIILAILTFGRVVWMASLVFEVKPTTYRAAKRHGLYSYSEMTEAHIGHIAAVGILANLFFAFVGYLLGFSEFSRLSIFYVFFNMLPFSDLDGNKVFFGNIILWSFLAALTLIGLAYAFFLI